MKKLNVLIFSPAYALDYTKKVLDEKRMIRNILESSVEKWNDISPSKELTSHATHVLHSLKMKEMNSQK